MKRTARIATAVALTVFLAAMSTGVSYALWSTTASTSAGVKAATILLAAQTDTGALSIVYSQTALTVTAPVTITNSGSVAFGYTAAFSATPMPTPTLSADMIGVEIWQSTDCTAPVDSATAWSGTLATLATAPSRTLAATTSMALCVRTTMDEATAQGQQGKFISGNIVFTGTNGWQSSASVALAQSVFTVPPPVFGANSCAPSKNEKDVDLTWTPTPGAVSYRLYFDPLATNLPTTHFQVAPAAAASVAATSFNTALGRATGTVTVRAIVGGWESAGAPLTVSFNPGSGGNNEKIYCPAPTTP